MKIFQIILVRSIFVSHQLNVIMLFSQAIIPLYPGFLFWRLLPRLSFTFYRFWYYQQCTQGINYKKLNLVYQASNLRYIMYNIEKCNLVISTCNIEKLGTFCHYTILVNVQFSSTNVMALGFSAWWGPMPCHLFSRKTSHGIILKYITIGNCVVSSCWIRRQR